MTQIHSAPTSLNLVLHESRVESGNAGPLLVGKRAFAGGLCIDAIFSLSAAAIAMFLGLKPDAYFAEGAFMTVVSALQIVAIAFLCVVIYQVRIEQVGSWRGPHVFWALAAAGLALMVFDEAAGLHEAIDRQIHASLHLQSTPWTDRIDDLIVLAYGVAAFAVVVAFRGELLRLMKLRKLFLYAAALFLIMVAADLLTNSYSANTEILIENPRLGMVAALANVLEDTTKLFTEAALFAGLLAAACMFRRYGRGAGSA